jgi:hypothetical protein
MCGTRTTDGTRKDLKEYAAEKKLLIIVSSLAINKETKSSFDKELHVKVLAFS